MDWYFNISMVVNRQLTEFSLFTVEAGFIPARFRIGKNSFNAENP